MLEDGLNGQDEDSIGINELKLRFHRVKVSLVQYKTELKSVVIQKKVYYIHILNIIFMKVIQK